MKQIGKTIRPKERALEALGAAGSSPARWFGASGSTVEILLDLSSMLFGNVVTWAWTGTVVKTWALLGFKVEIGTGSGRLVGFASSLLNWRDKTNWKMKSRLTCDDLTSNYLLWKSRRKSFDRADVNQHQNSDSDKTFEELHFKLLLNLILI